MPRFKGMQSFLVIWAGQLVSVVGTAMTRFALLVWAYERNGDATTLALIGFSLSLPYILVSPLAGIVVDRFNRRTVMFLTDSGSGLVTLALLALTVSGNLAVWHIFAAQLLVGIFDTFQMPAYISASTLLMDKKHFARASGLRTVAESGAQLLAPFLAALLLPRIGLAGVMLVDLLTFSVAMLTLLLAHVPTLQDPDPQPRTWQQQIWVGFQFILARRGLVGLAVIFVLMNFADGLTYSSILPAMVLGKTGGSEVALAWVQAGLGLGGLLGGLLVSTVGLPRRKIHAVLLFAALSFAFGDGQLALQRSVWGWAFGGFVAAIFIPFIISANTAIWQQKTPPHIQGRVFAARGMLQQFSRPIGFLLAGPLADRLFEPALASGGALVEPLGRWVGVGAGAGVALMFLCTATFGTLVSLGGYWVPFVRNVEEDLPDYEVIDGVVQPLVT